MQSRFFVCKKCGEWFEAPPLASHQANGLSKMEKCPVCGKWAIYPHAEARISPGSDQAPVYG
jgi:hypothetical protein